MSVDQPDPGEQWRDLTEHYARLSDDGLRAAGDEAYNLTEIARSVLRGEIKSRSLDIQLKEAYQPPQGDLDPADLEPELVVLRQVWSEDEARGAKEALDAAFIPSCFGRDNVERVSEIKTPYDEGVDVKVWEPHHQAGALGIAIGAKARRGTGGIQGRVPELPLSRHRVLRLGWRTTDRRLGRTLSVQLALRGLRQSVEG